MTTSAAPAVVAAVDLLDRAVAYTRLCLHVVTPRTLGRPTPCARWDLAALLDHMDDSLAAFAEASQGYLDLRRLPDHHQGSQGSQGSVSPLAGGPGLAVVDRLRTRACTLLAAWAEPPLGRVVLGDPGSGVSLAPEALLGVGALEIAVHGWDVTQATGERRTLPAALADDLLPVAAEYVTDADRPSRFGKVRTTGPHPDPATALLAHLGRTA
jgi:uncharacterized protein (TIGR03086 family)